MPSDWIMICSFGDDHADSGFFCFFNREFHWKFSRYCSKNAVAVYPSSSCVFLYSRFSKRTGTNRCSMWKFYVELSSKPQRGSFKPRFIPVHVFVNHNLRISGEIPDELLITPTFISKKKIWSVSIFKLLDAVALPVCGWLGTGKIIFELTFFSGIILSFLFNWKWGRKLRFWIKISCYNIQIAVFILFELIKLRLFS